MATAQNKIKKAVEDKLVSLLRKNAEAPKKEDLQVLGLSVKYLAVAAKLEESEYGKDLEGLDKAGDDDDESSIDP